MSSYLKNNLKRVINALTAFIFSFFPRSKKVVLLGGWYGQRFADNSKALYLFMHEYREELGLEKVLFTTKNPTIYRELRESGYDVLYTNSLSSLKYHLKAGYHIVDMGAKDLLRYASCDAKRINLWHGFPLKKIGYYDTHPHLSLSEAIAHNKAREELGCWNSFCNLVISEKHKEFQQHAFGLSDDQMILGIYPRIAYMLGYIKKFYLKTELRAKERIEDVIKQNKKIIGYFPTFRNKTEMNRKCFDLPRQIFDFLASVDGYLITKMHYTSDAQINAVNDRTINIPPEADLYNFLGYLDVLITDYSSVIFDFIMLKKPIVFYCFDLEYYESSDRGFLLDYNSFTPGDKALSVGDLIISLDRLFKDEADYLNRYSDVYASTLELTGKKSSYYNQISVMKLCESLL